MTTTQKYPDDIENTIYEILLSAKDSTEGINITSIVDVLFQKTNTKSNPQDIYYMIDRMCKEGMAEKTSSNGFKAIIFDGFFDLN
jgi:DNA-binding PadR family transcriptional regulator